MALRSHRLGNDRGAILVHVAMSLLALMAFTAFTLDYGVLWSSRWVAMRRPELVPRRLLGPTLPPGAYESSLWLKVLHGN